MPRRPERDAAGCRVAPVERLAGDHREHGRRIGDRARVRSDRVLRVRDRHDPARLVRPTVGLMPTTPFGSRGRRCCRRSRCRAQRRRDSPRRRHPIPNSSRTDCDRSRTDCCICPPRPLQPLIEWNERKFAHSHRLVFPRMTAPPARSLPRPWNRAAPAPDQRKRAGRRLHPIAGVDVVLQQDRNAMQRSEHRPRGAARLPRAPCQRVRIELDDGIQVRAASRRWPECD